MLPEGARVFERPAAHRTRLRLLPIGRFLSLDLSRVFLLCGSKRTGPASLSRAARVKGSVHVCGHWFDDAMHFD